MTVLSHQSILRHCVKYTLLDPWTDRTLHRETGMTYGAGAATYDVRIDQDLVLRPGDFMLGSTLERFKMPTWLCATVHDKSTLARMGICVQNTFIDPGWQGWLTLEITNHSRQVVALVRGQPIAQIKFERLDDKTDAPYRGKYDKQAREPVAAKFEEK